MEKPSAHPFSFSHKFLSQARISATKPVEPVWPLTPSPPTFSLSLPRQNFDSTPSSIGFPLSRFAPTFTLWRAITKRSSFRPTRPHGILRTQTDFKNMNGYKVLFVTFCALLSFAHAKAGEKNEGRSMDDYYYPSDSYDTYPASSYSSISPKQDFFVTESSDSVSIQAVLLIHANSFHPLWPSERPSNLPDFINT